MPNVERIKAKTIEWAKGVLEKPFYVLDSETGGLSAGYHEIIQLAVINHEGRELVNTLIQPLYPDRIGQDAVRIHGIMPEMLAGAPTFKIIYRQLRELLEGQTVFIYNYNYDYGMLKGQCSLNDLELFQFGEDSTCVMEQYARYFGAWSDYHQSFRWQRLPGGDHSAIGDCRATLALIQRMAGVTVTKGS